MIPYRYRMDIGSAPGKKRIWVLEFGVRVKRCKGIRVKR